MKPTLLDTDTVSHFVRRQPAVVDHAYKDAQQQMQQFKALTHLHRIIPLTVESVNYSARIEADLRRRGLSIGPTDTLIAGVALAADLVLATSNTRHFERIEGLQLANWMQ
jgi:predicted nucleic acid-binding protein